ncbi:antibiotic biosynthesis monooxygenase family protein [Streptococcus sp. NLN64]|uniref:antibiotic biosynthesis monooxygenase family protein n=1 Tax=Streptococcus sp. NLN64 TaxID=2822799 RepID=UPI0018C9FFDE|nr:antibiotic biosynthesis monooxygenase family protein [Streptococcus sp. NLN64]MBG9367866.1 antibiotic biosynthesis monooxygenase [Streptococcus sp. NLN64]
MKPVMNLFRIAIHSEDKDTFLGVLSHLAKLTKEVEPGFLSLFAFRSPDQEDVYLILEVFASNQAYLSYLNSATYKAYQEVTQPLIREQAYIRLEGLVLLEKLSDKLPESSSGLRLSLFQEERPNPEALDRIQRLAQDYVLKQMGLHAFYLAYDQQSPKDWYQVEIFSDRQEENLLGDEAGFDHAQVTLRWDPKDLVDFPLGVDVVSTRGAELVDLLVF